MHRKTIVTLSLFLLLPSLLLGCSNKKVEDPSNNKTPLSKTEFFMGTAVSISLYDNKDEAIIKKAFDRVKEIEDEISINKEKTDLDKINDASGKEAVKAKDTTFEIVKKGLYYSNLANGTFDITIGPLVKLWSIGLPEQRLPSDKEINEKKALVNYKDLELNENNKTIFLKKPEMIIDLGGIAKGYTADEIAEILKENNVSSAIIDLGGNIYVIGKNSNTNNPWKIGIQDPLKPRGDIIGSINAENKSIVTSGIYERYFEENGKRYHHILSPASGYPYDNEIAGISILSDYSIDGDALSTTVFSKGLKEGLELLETLPNVEGVFITKDKKVYLTKGIKSSLTITNKEYEIMN